MTSSNVYVPVEWHTYRMDPTDEASIWHVEAPSFEAAAAQLGRELYGRPVRVRRATGRPEMAGLFVCEEQCDFTGSRAGQHYMHVSRAD